MISVESYSIYHEFIKGEKVKEVSGTDHSFQILVNVFGFLPASWNMSQSEIIALLLTAKNDSDSQECVQ